MGDKNFSHLNEDNDEEEENEVIVLIKDSPFLSESDDEYVGTLVSKESSFESTGTGFSLADDGLLKDARSDSVRWVLKMKAFFGFKYETAYLAMSYFDRCLVHPIIDGGKIWAMKLLAVACLSLAAKMKEFSAPALSEYQLEEFQFSSNAIQRMELLVLNTLEWRMCLVTPFAYLSYFASKFECKVDRKDLLSRATGFIFSIIEVVNLVDYRPSTISAAAILAASSDKLTKDLVESKMSIISLPESLASDHVYSCYALMIQKSQKEKLKQPKLLFCSEVSANCTTSVITSIDLHNDTSFLETGNKRRRLQSPPHIK